MGGYSSHHFAVVVGCLKRLTARQTGAQAGSKVTSQPSPNLPYMQVENVKKRKEKAGKENSAELCFC